MADPFVGEIKIVAMNYPPRGWSQCDGQILPVNQNQALFALIGVNYGGNGSTNFALPDLRGRTPVAAGPATTLGTSAGTETVILTADQLPPHSHTFTAIDDPADKPGPTGRLYARSPIALYAADSNPLIPVAASAVQNSGGNTAHNNMQPFLALNFCISLQGIYPARN